MMIHLGKCEEVIKKLESNKYQLIYFNPPFQFFEAKWDKEHLDYENLWGEIWRVLKPKGCVIIHSSQRFTGYLINTQSKYFRYFYTWKRNNKSNFLQAKIQPLRQIEQLCVFYKKLPTYNPQMKLLDKPRHYKTSGKSKLYTRCAELPPKTYTHSYPTDLLEYPTIKGIFSRPIELCDFIILTYTNENDNVLDLTCGNAITGLSCKKLKRNYVGIDVNKDHYELSRKNLNAHNLTK
jgi:site-specific DNA-methyltransferase (adenine-specific)